jgi:hypothetical protein
MRLPVAATQVRVELRAVFRAERVTLSVARRGAVVRHAAGRTPQVCRAVAVHSRAPWDPAVPERRAAPRRVALQRAVLQRVALRLAVRVAAHLRLAPVLVVQRRWAV